MGVHKLERRPIGYVETIYITNGIIKRIVKSD